MAKFDLHIHSSYSSDGLMNPKTIVKIAIKRHLSGIAVTDHNTIKGGLKAKNCETGCLKTKCNSTIG